MRPLVSPAERDMPENITYLELEFFDCFWAGKCPHGVGAEHKWFRYPTTSCRITIRQKDTKDSQLWFKKIYSWKINVLMLDIGSLGPGLCGILLQFTGPARNIHQTFGTAGMEPHGTDYKQQNQTHIPPCDVRSFMIFHQAWWWFWSWLF